jgi:hypothetical protein
MAIEAGRLGRVAVLGRPAASRPRMACGPTGMIDIDARLDENNEPFHQSSMAWSPNPMMRKAC